MKLMFSFVLISLAIVRISIAQEVYVDMPQSNGYLGVPMKLVVVYKNIESEVSPSIPEIDGFSIQKSTGTETSSQTTFINGKVTSTSTSKHTFFLTPTTIGSLTIPALTFVVDGKAFQTTPKTIEVINTPTSGSLKAEVLGSKGDLYLGQPIDLTLKIFVEKFSDPTLGVTINEQDMFRLLSNNSSFGMFTKALQEGRAHVQTIEDLNDEGELSPFYLYTVQSTTWPETTGEFEPENMSFAINYPLSLERVRGDGFFNRDSIQVAKSQLISAKAVIPPITILTPPLHNQPEWYTGAVGNFDFRVVAQPTSVKVGEPITITMRVTDQSSGPINLDYLSAPALDRVSALTNNFKVPSSSLGGTVQSRTKTFTQTIRPSTSEVHEIPALPMSSFNPKTETYDTVWTKPIPIIVEAVATVTANDLVGGNTQNTNSTVQKATDVEGGILANYTGTGLLQSQTSEVTYLLLIGIIIPPFVCACILCCMFYKRQSETDSAKQKGEKKQAIKTIKSLSTATNSTQVQQLAQALRTLQSNTNEAEHVQTLLKRCDAAQFGGQLDETLASDANKLVGTLS
ncbi:MAG: hypothetical protein HOC27_08075 [Phycisphaerae bacterium]|nr:hypothetical protein [Phycisphaerae bacterium]